MPPDGPSPALSPAASESLRAELADLAPREGPAGDAPLSDFGRVVEAAPAAVVEAHDPSAVKRAFESARKHGVSVSTQGTAHSCGGQSLCDGGLLLRNRIGGAVEWVADDEVEAPSGLPWQAVESALNERGRAVPVLPSVLDISVGGTLAVGGYGTNTPARGAQIDHVRELDLLAPDGRTYRCSPQENEDLFRFSLAGSGQLGLITRVRLGSDEHLADGELHGYRFDSLSAMARSLEWMNDGSVRLPPYLRAFSYKPERPGIALYGDLSPSGGKGAGDGLAVVREALGEPRTKMPVTDVRAMEHEFDLNWVGRYPGHRRLWIDFGFSYPAFRDYCDAVQGLAVEGAFGKAIRAVYVSVVPRSPHGSDFFPFDIRPAGAERTFTCGIYCMVPEDDADVLERVRGALRTCVEKMTELGGRPYIYGFNQMGPMDWRRAFGEEAVDALIALKERLDPSRVIPAPWDRIPPVGRSSPVSRRFGGGSASRNGAGD